MTTGMNTITNRAKYTATFSAVTIAAIQDLFEIIVPAGKVILLHEVGFTTDATATTKQRVRIKRLPVTVTSGSGGSTTSPVAMFSPFDNSSVTTVDINNTTQATTSGTAELIIDEYADLNLGWIYDPIPTRIPVFSAGEAVVVDFPAAPSSLTVSGNIIWEELEAVNYQ